MGEIPPLMKDIEGDFIWFILFGDIFSIDYLLKKI